MSELEEKYKEQVNIFLQNDQHASDIIRLFQAMELAFEKLKPFTSEVVQKRFEVSLWEVRGDLSKHLNEHMETVVKEVNNAQNN